METSHSITGIIVADDDAMIRSVLRACFEAINLNVFVAYDGSEAVQLAQRMQAALIILDLKMPNLNGLEACLRIRQQPANAHTPIVILTSAMAKGAETAAAAVGATEYYQKPFRAALLLQAVSRFLPISDAVRDQIRRNADRANGIVEVAPTPVANLSSAKPGSDDPLDRGKYILDVLRR